MAEPVRTLNRWEQKLEGLVWVTEEPYSYLGERFSLRSTDASFARFADEFLAPLRRARLDDDEPPSMSADCGAEAEVSGLHVRRKFTLYFGTIAIYRGFSFHEMTARLLEFVRTGSTRFKDEYVQLRAGSISLDGAAVVLPGPEDHRLAALSAALVERGGSLFGDDLTLIEPVDRTIEPLGLPLLVDARAAASLFPDVAPELARQIRGVASPARWRVPLVPAALGGGLAQETTKPTAIVVPEFRDEGPTTIEPMDSSAAMFAASRSILNWHIWGERGLLLLHDLLAGAAALRLTASSVERAADLVVEELRAGRLA